ncbi:MAG: hypothetical protein M1828_003218 [Chrysothrix sp. TS-e1954]|nr:MAG: hypothetical protein M1828_003218 [Chrysothrix sp. TS-e1954]
MTSVNSKWQEELENGVLLNLPMLLINLGIDHYDVSFLRSGGYHMVFAYKAKIDGQELEFVVRIPLRSECPGYQDTRVQAAVLRYLRQTSLGTKIPKVIAFDTTQDNAIGSQYIIQERIAGASLDDFDDLEPDQTLRQAELFADLILDLEKVTFQRAGHFTKLQSPSEKSFSDDIDILNWQTWQQKINKKLDSPRPVNETVYGLLATRIQAGIADSKKTDSQGALERWRQLDVILDDMKMFGWFDDYDANHPIVLCHADLYPRNIVAKFDSTCGLTLAGVLDWDNAEAVPRVLARRPPHHLWEVSDGKRHGAVIDDCDFYDEEELRPSGPGYDVQEHFDAYMKEKDPSGRYDDEAYGRGRWLRRLAMFVLERCPSYEVPRGMTWFRKEWAMYCYRVDRGIDSDGEVMYPKDEQEQQQQPEEVKDSLSPLKDLSDSIVNKGKKVFRRVRSRSRRRRIAASDADVTSLGRDSPTSAPSSSISKGGDEATGQVPQASVSKDTSDTDACTIPRRRDLPKSAPPRSMIKKGKEALTRTFRRKAASYPGCIPRKQVAAGSAESYATTKRFVVNNPNVLSPLSSRR